MAEGTFDRIAQSFRIGRNFMRDTYKKAIDQGEHLLFHMDGAKPEFNKMCQTAIDSAKAYREGIGKKNKAWIEFQEATRRAKDEASDANRSRADDIGMSL